MNTPQQGEEDGPPAPPAMVKVRDAYKSYGPKGQTLRGLNMAVPRGAIYALLGPSGCGKTTLLGCMVGRRHLDSGQIFLGVKYNHQVGYMPQDTALVGEITIGETLYFYCNLFGLTKEKFEKRKEELFSCLEIPSESRTIETLSGGEQRRVSLCVTLLHDAELVILDEPTVGQDPLLCNRIWQYFLELTSIGEKTIILTTHYIEEANQAHRVGMMRGGVLLVEGCPKKIKAEFHSENLDDVFLCLTEKQEAAARLGQSPETTDVIQSIRAPNTKSPLKNMEFFSFRRVKAHIFKYVYWIFRSKGILCFLLLLPIALTSVFALCIGRNPFGLKVGVVNEELERGRLEDCKGTFNCSSPIFLSCLYLHHLEKKDMNLIEFNDATSARKSALRGDIWGYLMFGRNYTGSLLERLEKNLHTPNDILESSTVAISLDMSNMQIGSLLQRDMFFAHVDYLEELYINCDWPVKASRIPFQYETMYGSLYSDFRPFGVASTLSLYVFFLPYMLTVASIIPEKKEGIFERNIISGLTMAESLLGHSIFIGAILIVQTISMLVVNYVIFEITMKGSILLTFILCMLTGFSGMFYGFLVSIICNRDVESTFIGVGTMFILVCLCGLIWPYEALGSIMKRISYYIPITASAEALRSIASKDYGLSHPRIYIAILILLSWAIICLVGTYILVKLKEIFRKIKK